MTSDIRPYLTGAWDIIEVQGNRVVMKNLGTQLTLVFLLNTPKAVTIEYLPAKTINNITPVIRDGVGDNRREVRPATITLGIATAKTNAFRVNQLVQDLTTYHARCQAYIATENRDTVLRRELAGELSVLVQAQKKFEETSFARLLGSQLLKIDVVTPDSVTIEMRYLTNAQAKAVLALFAVPTGNKDEVKAICS